MLILSCSKKPQDDTKGLLRSYIDILSHTVGVPLQTNKSRPNKAMQTEKLSQQIRDKLVEKYKSGRTIPSITIKWKYDGAPEYLRWLPDTERQCRKQRITLQELQSGHRSICVSDHNKTSTPQSSRAIWEICQMKVVASHKKIRKPVLSLQKDP